MGNLRNPSLILCGLGLAAIGSSIGCEMGDDAPAPEQSLSALMDDGDAAAVAPGAMVPPGPVTPPPRFCPDGDCSRAPLAFWKLDDCNPFSTELADSAFSSIAHPAFRAVSVACVPAIDNQGIRLSGGDDIMYSPDQPDFQFGSGLTVAAWIKPDRVTGTQTIVRKRFDGTSSFLLAIDGRRLAFVLRLSSGRFAAVTAPIQAGRFTHVAATYDGQQAILYVDGAAAARTRAAGTIAPGVGPIFVGNDANGRQLAGIVDDVWVNTLAAPADVIKGLTCIRQPPIVALSPAASPPVAAGTTVPFDLAVTNQSGASCPADTFDFFSSVPFPLSSDAFFGTLSAGPGQTAHATVNVTSAPDAPIGSFPFQLFVTREGDFQTATATATYVVGSTSPACFGTPPLTPLITGVPFSPAGGTFAFSAPGLIAPAVSPVFGPDGSTQALQVAINPGASTDPANAFLGFGVFFANPPCLDARAFTGVKFTITGDLGTCSLALMANTSEDNNVAFGPFGRCSAASCFGPSSGPLALGTNTVRFADMTGGSPMPTVDAAALNGIQWVLNVPTDGVSAPCVANLVVSDVSFVSDAVQSVSYTFDTSTQGWELSTFQGAPFTNLGAPGAAPAATLVFAPMDGDPSPGALRVTAPFTALDQDVDPIVNLGQPGIDLSGGVLHARARLVAGAFPDGGVQFHASSGPTFAFTGAFMDASQFPLGQWVPVTLDLTSGTSPGFDPTQVVQIGVQFFSGFSSGGGTFQGSADTVFEIDTVTN